MNTCGNCWSPPAHPCPPSLKRPLFTAKLSCPPPSALLQEWWPSDPPPLQLGVEKWLCSSKNFFSLSFPMSGMQNKWLELKQSYCTMREKAHSEDDSHQMEGACTCHTYMNLSRLALYLWEEGGNQPRTSCYFRLSDTYRPTQPNIFSRPLRRRVVNKLSKTLFVLFCMSAEYFNGFSGLTWEQSHHLIHHSFTEISSDKLFRPTHGT